MPHLTDARKSLAYLREAINGLRHWVMITDLERIHAMQVLVAGSLLVAGACEEKDLGYGVVRFVGKSGESKLVSFLVIPKEKMPRERLEAALDAFGMAFDPGARGDLVCSGADEQATVAPLRVLEHISGGSVTAPGPEDN